MMPIDSLRQRLDAARLLPAIAACSVLSACNFAPRYNPPTPPPTAVFKEAVPPPAGAGGPGAGQPAPAEPGVRGSTGGGTRPADKPSAGAPDPAAVAAAAQGWKLAEPGDAPIRASWWEVYDDPQLNDLEARVAISNQSIVAAEANYRAALALAQEAQAQLFPTLSLSPSATRSKSSAALAGIGGGASTGTVGGATTGTGATTTATGGTTPAGTTTTAGTTTSGSTQSLSTSTHNIFTVPLAAAYQVDLWGSIRNTVAENRYAAQASAAQLANALLSTQSTLAQDYFQLRVADEQRRILESTVADYQSSLRLVRTLVESGVDSQADVATAEAQLASATASATDTGVARAQYEHAIAVLIGVPPAALSIPYKRLKQQLPAVPVGLPSELLERRPDIAAAERQVAESNAQIGVARAAYFPSLTLSASGGYESTAVSNLFTLPNRFWSAGPTLVQALFDGGARRAAVAQARAQNDSQVATYRQTVLSAFQSVEDNLAALRILSAELGQAHQATVAAKRAVELTVVLFRNGVDSYVNVITAQNAYLTARETELGVELRQLTASVSLINDLGGGWTASGLGGAEHLAQHPPPAGAAAEVPAENSGPGVANPPSMPPGEIEPDELIRQNDEASGGSPTP
jgi:NodT family efflux transporter outer membrane factor (OMF) lipoprotein